MMRLLVCLVLGLTQVLVACTPRSHIAAQAVRDQPPRFVGRTLSEPDGAVRLSWSATQVVTAFDGPSITVRLEDAADYEHRAPSANSAADAHAVRNVFDVVIDAQPPKVVAMHPHQTRYVLAEGLSAGAHTLTLIKRTEPLVGEVRLVGFETAAGAHLLAPSKPKARRLELIGDSITAGYGNEGQDANCSFTSLTENGDLAFGPMTGRALGADVSVIAWSGHGLVRNRDMSTTDLLPELYQRLIASRAQPAYNPSVWHPGAVVINLGTNDFAPGLPDAGRFEAAYVSLISAIHTAHPQAHVFMAIGPMLSDDSPKGQHHLSIARGLHHAVIKQLKAHGNSQVTLVEFPVQDGRRGFGCDWHPSLATHAAMAAQLTHVIRETLGW